MGIKDLVVVLSFAMVALAVENFWPGYGMLYHMIGVVLYIGGKMTCDLNQ